MNTLLSIVLLIQYSICVLLYTHGTLLKHLKALYNNIMLCQVLDPNMGGLIAFYPK